MAHLGLLRAKLLKITFLIEMFLRVEHEDLQEVLVYESFQGRTDLGDGLLLYHNRSHGSSLLSWLLNLDIFDLLYFFRLLVRLYSLDWVIGYRFLL